MRTTLAFAATVVALVVPPWSWGQTCPEAVGHWPYGVTYASAFSAGRAYVGNGAALQVLDVTDPSNPAVIGEVVLPDAPKAIVEVGTLLYVADGLGGLRIVDVSEPHAPVEIGGVKTPGTGWDVAVSGSHAYVTGFGFGVVDVSDPAAPRLVASSPTFAFRLDVAGGFAYLAALDTFRVVDISDPGAPVEVASLPMGNALDVVVSGGLAYVADASASLIGVRVVDVSDPTAPVEVGSGSIAGGQPTGVTLVDGYLYATSGGLAESLRVLSLASPTTPVELGTVVLESIAEPYSFSAGGGLGGLADATRLRLVDVSQPTPPFQAGLLDTGEPANDVAVVGERAFVADCSGVRVVDVSDLSAPTQLGAVEVPPCAVAIAAAGDLVFTLGTDGYLSVVDVSVPSLPVVMARLGIGGAGDLAVEGTHLFVAAGYGGLRVVDVSDPASPVEVASLPISDYPDLVAVEDHLALVATDDVVMVVDVTVPSAPVTLGSCSAPGWIRGLAVSGRRAGVATAYDGLHVVDFSNPSTPTLVGTCDTSTGSGAVTLEGAVAYVLTGGWGLGGSGLGVVDLSDPAQPTLRAFGRSSLAAEGLAVSGGRVFLAGEQSGSDGGLATFDATQGFGPVEVGSHPVGPVLRDVATSGTHAYAVADGDVTVFSMDGAGAPQPVGSLVTPGRASALELVSGHLLVADGSALLSADLGQPQDPVVVGSVAVPATMVVADPPLALVSGADTVSVVDVGNPASPNVRGTLALPGAVWDIAVDGSLGAAVINGDLRLLDLSNPDHPQWVGIHVGWYQAVALSAGHAYLGSTTDLRVLDVSDPASPVEVAVLPIPGDAIAVSGSLAVVTGWGRTTVLDLSDPAAPVPIGGVATPAGNPFVAAAGDVVALSTGDAGLWRLELGGCAGAVFADGFDSGGAALWSLTVP